MAAGSDKLLDFLLTGIAICGVQGASSADFRRIVGEYYNTPTQEKDASPTYVCDTAGLPKNLDRKFHEQAWQWVTNHPDIRICYQGKARKLSLSEFEDLEAQETGAEQVSSSENSAQQNEVPAAGNSDAAEIASTGPSDTLTSLGASLRQQLSAESTLSEKELTSQPDCGSSLQSDSVISTPSQKVRELRKMPQDTQGSVSAFEKPSDSIQAPRLFASQNRTWKAITGHSIDLKKVPGSEFILLSIIATAGPKGIPQPVLQKLSKQDKRSVPRRTGELFKKGYIEKRPIQEGSSRTSLCIHRMFLKSAPKEPQSVHDVFRIGSVNLTGLVYLLDELLQNTSVVQVRHLRVKLGVELARWNGRAVRSAVQRLAETEYLRRFLIGKKNYDPYSDEKNIVCIQRLREPNEEDIRNLNFKRHATGPNVDDAVEEEPLEDDDVGDGLMRDMELDTIDQGDSEDNEFDTPDRIPPQWTPDRLPANILYQAVEMAGPDGTDAQKLRERLTGFFWKRPIDSFISRVTDGWEQSQPQHIRHLAIIRDTTVSNETRRAFYIYRTYENFQKAVEAGEVAWEALRPMESNNSAHPQKQDSSTAYVDSWGFPIIDAKDLHRRTGSATLVEACRTIVHSRKFPRDWETKLLKSSTDREVSSTPDQDVTDGSLIPVKSGSSSGYTARVPKASRVARPLLTQAERLSLGLPAKGRLGIDIESQIRAHRKKTGDRNSIPDKLIKGGKTGAPKSKPKYERRPGPPLLTREQRKARGLPEHGRLSYKVTEQILREQGRNESLTHMESFYEDVDFEEDVAMPGNDEPGSGELAVVKEPPKRKRGRPPKKRQIDEGDAQAERPKKRNRKNSDKSKIRDPPDNSSLDIPDNPRAELLLESEEGAEQISDVVVSLPHPGGQGILHSDDISSSAAVGENKPATPSQPSKTAKVLRRTPAKNAKEQKAQPPPTQAVLHVRAVKARYEDRTEPGLYIDPFATQPASGKGGQGRPKKLFLATFKLPGLQKLSWFVPDGTQGANIPAATLPTHIEANTRKYSSAPQEISTGSSATPVHDLASENDALEEAKCSPDASERRPASQDLVIQSPIVTVDTQIGTEERADITQAPMEMQPAESSQTSASPSISPAVSMDIDDSAAEIAQSVEAALETSKVVETTPEADEQRLPPVNNGSSTQQQSSSTAVRLSQPRRMPRLPPSMSTTTWRRTVSYQSPYAPLPSQELAQRAAPDTAHQFPPVDNGMSRERVSRSTSVLEASASKLQSLSKPFQKDKPEKNHRGVTMGKGSVTHSRTRIFRHIFDLCGGVFPGNGEIYPVFEAVWEDLGPKKTACPTQSTLRKSLRDLIHPASLLREMIFNVPGVGLLGNTRKRIFFHKDLDVQGPEVIGLMRGMIQAYPNKYCPPGIEKYWKEEVKPVKAKPVPRLPELPKALADELFEPTSKRLEERIEIAREERRKFREARDEQRRIEREAQKQAQKKARKEQRELEKEQKRQEKYQKALSKTRTRLRGLDDGLQFRTNKVAQMPISTSEERPVSFMPVMPPFQQPHESSSRRESSARSDSSDEEPPTKLQPYPGIDWHEHTSALTAPTVRCHPTTHTFSTDFIVDTPSVRIVEPHSTATEEPKGKGRKRVRIQEPEDEASRKKTRELLPKTLKLADKLKEFMAQHEIEEEGESSEEEEDMRLSPTIAERLAGLTGDLKQPDYEPRERKRERGWTKPRENRRKDRPRRRYNAVKDRKYPQAFDPLGEFRKLCYTLVIASSMAGEEGSVDWNIVTKVYNGAPRFDLEKTKRVWTWMQRKMTSQIRGMTGSFQSLFLSAYEEGKVDAIEDPDTYDWVKLVRWASMNCTYDESPLPLAREGLEDCQFEISEYEVLDRTLWHTTTLTSVNREDRFAKFTFGSPLHQTRKPRVPGDEHDLKARALIRSNISTPKELYDKNLAYSKLSQVPTRSLESTVDDLVRARYMKMRQRKKLLPGRNYIFTPHFAKHYRHTFELSDFMAAVKLKKDLDTTFATSDPEKPYFVSRVADCGTVMAILSLVSEGKIDLIPRLPPTKNEFDAELPRISVWGFSEGDYSHRKMDRKRLFWPLEVLPTASYEYGNPLQPVPSLLALQEDGTPASWEVMPTPPLPALQNPDALLPIWNTIDGQTIIYPWWNRILNIVVQCVLFQPGNTASEIYSRCQTYTTEIFEVQLVLDWLVAVRAAKLSPHGTYEVLPGYWAVFGDRLIDEENDEFGEHVKRNPTIKKLVPTWRSEANAAYNLRQSTLQQSGAQEGSQAQARQENSAHEKIFNNARKQYTIARHAAEERTDESSAGGAEQNAVVSEPQPQAQNVEQQNPVSNPTLLASADATFSNTPEDIQMTDPDADAEGEDIDAEGEPDYEYM